MSAYNIRRAVFSDCIDILYVYNDANKSLGYPAQDILSTFEEMVQNNSTFVLLDKEKIIAFISAKINSRRAFISALYVMYNKQRKGLGSKLLRFFEEDLLKKRC
ncbi:MAG: hypothetical protein CR988_08355 [Treponema sp.]|nr:MAG: hypothetical protein CR988_08355 [Treponema sp.]